MSGDRRAVLTYAPSSALDEGAGTLTECVSHLLAANDALIPGRWGVHATLGGLEIRRPGAAAAEHECDLGCDCVRYCPDCVREPNCGSGPEQDAGSIEPRQSRVPTGCGGPVVHIKPSIPMSIMAGYRSYSWPRSLGATGRGGRFPAADGGEGCTGGHVR